MALARVYRSLTLEGKIAGFLVAAVAELQLPDTIGIFGVEITPRAVLGFFPDPRKLVLYYVEGLARGLANLPDSLRFNLACQVWLFGV